MLNFILISTLALWIAFIMLTRIVGDARTRRELNFIQRIAVYVFVAGDILYNLGPGAVLFLEPSRGFHETLTMRMKRILHSGDYRESSWRFKLAYFICRYMVEPWDFGHCALRAK